MRKNTQNSYKTEQARKNSGPACRYFPAGSAHQHDFRTVNGPGKDVERLRRTVVDLHPAAEAQHDAGERRADLPGAHYANGLAYQVEAGQAVQDAVTATADELAAATEAARAAVAPDAVPADGDAPACSEEQLDLFEARPQAGTPPPAAAGDTKPQTSA